MTRTRFGLLHVSWRSAACADSARSHTKRRTTSHWTCPRILIFPGGSNSLEVGERSIDVSALRSKSNKETDSAAVFFPGFMRCATATLTKWSALHKHRQLNCILMLASRGLTFTKNNSMKLKFYGTRGSIPICDAGFQQ